MKRKIYIKGKKLHTELNSTYSNLITVLAERKKISLVDPARKPSAVLIPIYDQGGRFFILFTKRTELVRYHKGEISFPGGGFDPGDTSLQHTALRESQEEIGLLPTDVTILGELDDFKTRHSNYIIAPFVGKIKPDYQFISCAFEIAEIIVVPIDALLETTCRLSEPETMEDGEQVTAYVYNYKHHKITGATARILNQFLGIFSRVLPPC
jgi:8-oxo-dGTP pyrophosphatase MutT (NUDIX family)